LRPTLEGTEPVNERPAKVMSFAALPGAETKYTKVKAWIDEQSCTVVQAEFYEDKKLSKQLSSPKGSLKQAGPVWYVSEYEMRDPAAGTHTVLRLGKVNTEKKAPDGYFDPNRFFLVP
jgi:hypothetical protein